MPTKVGGPSVPAPAAPTPDDGTVESQDGTTEGQVATAGGVLKESVKDTTRPPEDDQWDANDARDEYAWQNMDTTPTLRKADEGNVASRSRSTSVSIDKAKTSDGEVTTRSRGNEKTESETVTSKGESETETGKTKREGVGKEGNVVLAGADVVHQKVVGDQMHIVHGKGPGGTTTDAYYQGPSISLSGYGEADAHMMHNSHFAPGVDLKVSVRVDANLIAGGASITKDIPVEYRGQKFDVIVRLGANGNVGANGDLNLDVHLGTDGVSVSAAADGFAGAKGSLLGSAEVDMNGKELMGGEMQVSFAAGAGAGASFSADMHHFHASAYATVGAGVGVQLDGEVYASNIAAAIPHIISGH